MAGAAPEDEFDRKYTARLGPKPELTREEIAVMERMSDLLSGRVRDDEPAKRRHALIRYWIAEDPELAALDKRLKEISERNPASAARILARLSMEEEEAEEEAEADDL